MPDILAITAWDVPDEGFRWVDAYAFGRSVSQTLERFLVPKVKASQNWKRYWPLLDTPALFRAFAETEPSETGVLEFASRSGWMGIAQDIEIPVGAEGSFEFDFTKGESLTAWSDEIHGLRHV